MTMDSCVYMCLCDVLVTWAVHLTSPERNDRMNNVLPDFAPSGGSIPQIRASASSPNMQSPRSKQTSPGCVVSAVFRVTKPASSRGQPWRLESRKDEVKSQKRLNSEGDTLSAPGSTYNRVCRERLFFSASANCRVRLMLQTTPRFRLSWASDRDSETLRQMRAKSRSDSWQPRTDSSRTLSSFRLSQMSWTSAAESSSPVI